MRLILIVPMLFLYFITVQMLFSQNIIFNPVSDTIKVVDGCFVPAIKCTLKSTTYLDSIIISPGDYTYIEYIDSSGNWISTPNCFYLISDSFNINNYELWYIPQHSFPYIQQIPFDSSFYTDDQSFKIKLRVTSQGNPVDSLSQLFITQYGLGIDDVQNIGPRMLVLYQNYPNPFNSSTVIRYFKSKNSKIKISIYDVSGKLIETLLNERQIAGTHSIKWDSHHINSGVYFIKISSEGYSIVKKCILIK